MSEHNIKNITPAVQAALKETWTLSSARLCRELGQMTRRLRLHYQKINQHQSHAPVEEWLCDNYYVLEKECKQSIKDIRQLARRATYGELERFYKMFESVLFGEMPPLDDETMGEILSTAERQQHITETQFGFVPVAIKAVLIKMAYVAVFEQGSEEMIRYAIVGLGKLTSIDFDEIIYACSCVEQILLRDPAGVYPNMDSDSRSYYRHLIARISIATRQPEDKVAEEMLASCQEKEQPENHIGYPILHHPLFRRFKRRGKITLTLGVLLPLLASAFIGWYWRSPLAAFLCFLPLWEMIRTPLWQGAMAGVNPDFLPRMDPKKITKKPKTVVLVSTLLPGVGQVPALADRLSQLYYSNSDPDMYYCVLADFKEWDLPTDEKDDSQVAAASQLIERLNRDHGDRFMLFLRGRTFNKTQNRYSGWERKRGAITEFIRYVKGEKVSLHTFVGDSSALPKIKYIIALDADTNLLYESAQTLVMAAIHPLNTPVIGKDGVVTNGYGILAPKISPDLESAKATAFSQVMSGCGGVTAYETRDKDFYQDLFGESIFAGKGLIDLDAFYIILSDRFPENQILSHDILEGAYLRTAFVSDVEMTDTSPSGMSSWLSRLHRWIRGDWQNIKFMGGQFRAGGQTYQNPIGALSRYKLFDNLRRSLTPVASLLCLVAALFAEGGLGVLFALTGLLGVMFPSLWAAVFSILSGGFFTLSRKFFTRTLPHTFELMGQGLFLLLMLPAQSFITVDAVVRSLWRTLISHKKMLEWTTAAQSEARGATLGWLLGRFWLAELFGIAYLALGASSALSIVGAAFVLLVPVALWTAKPSVESGGQLSSSDRDTLISYNAAMWRYYEEFADDANHYLPPDNIQQSPVFRVANRTSPTNIGMMLLSILTARDLDFIDTDGMYRRIERTFASVEKLKTWHGNLYNWYDTLTLNTLHPEYVSTVDSGNFICSLVALVEGLREYVREKPELKSLIARIEKMTEETDLTVFYNKKKNLFSIGYDVPADALTNSHYDFLLSEARLTSYYAVARKLVGKKHWGSLVRTMSRCGSYAGAVSWTGTMFEYYMPHLLLPVYEGSLLGEALIYCLYCQKRRVKGQDVPWGISESAFYAFDNNLNYQYKAHGVQKIGVKRYLDKELVISPYSTFLTISQNPNSAMKNLRKLHQLGVYGRYGFFEAVDFTPERVGQGGLAVTRSYMAHHIGMSMVASCNALLDNRMQKRFMKNHYMRSANEFLQEKIAKNTVVYDELKNTESRGEKHERPAIRDESSAIYPQSPKATLISNGELTDILTDTGAGYLKLGEIDVTRRSTDILRRSQGILTLVRMSGTTLSATQAPFFDRDTRHSVEYEQHSVTYYARKKEVEVGVRCLIHPTISCEQRQIVIKNDSASRQVAQVLVYLEPVLSSYQDYSAHPCFSKLFVSAKYDETTRTLTFLRRARDGSRSAYLTAGFLQNHDFSYETRRDKLMKAPGGVLDLKQFHKLEFSGGNNNQLGIPDACCALKLDVPVAAGGQSQITLLLCAAHTESEAVSGILSMRKLGVLEAKQAAKSPLLENSLEGRLGSGILGQLLFPHQGGDAEARRANILGQSGLWSAGISGDLPIALMELSHQREQEAVESYLRLHASLRSFKVEFDLVLLYEYADAREQLRMLVEKNSVINILGSRGGVFLLHRETTPPELITLLRAVSRHTFRQGQPINPAVSGQEYRPVEILPLTPAPMPERPDLQVEGGAFADGTFYVNKKSPLPWCHVLANPAFGTLVSDSALGYTWAVNSRENKLTPWYNDICTDNNGEMILLAVDGRTYDLLQGARASFSDTEARWRGRGSHVASDVRVTVSGKGCAKYIDVSLHNQTNETLNVMIAYYIEPVLGVTRDTAANISFDLAEHTLLMHNPYNTAVRSHAALTAAGENHTLFTTEKAAFLCGNWRNGGISSNNDPCGAAVLPLEIGGKGEVTVRFVLSYGATAASALYMAQHEIGQSPNSDNSITIRTCDPALNEFINHFCPHQIYHSRMVGRTAFYQCGGAYGFRDQLQDAMAYQLYDPQLLRRQIIRCCAVQFEEGDVLHWWHPLPGKEGLKGVRTRFSDDLLWLPLSAAEYVTKTGDASLLNVPVRYLRAEPLAHGEQERYLIPGKSDVKEDVFAHCVRAIEKGCNLGEGGLPLIGCGDWNDGFSSVGAKGRGRSVWLAMFLVVVLEHFAPLCREKGKPELAEQYLSRAGDLRLAIDEHCWDGDWYLRAFYDNGEKMGGSRQRECAIDLLPQSFAVAAGMPDRERVASGLDNAYQRLVNHKLRLVKLFAEPFRCSDQQPGYVKAYPEGIRENGGQYTHSAVWFGIANLRVGEHDRGWEILRMLNPVDRATHRELFQKYGLEPYYMAADIYANPALPGRGGWSIYTGAASWYLRAILEELMGLNLRGDKLYFAPRLPSGWNRAAMEVTIKNTRYEVTFTRAEAPGMFVNGQPVEYLPLDGVGGSVRVDFA